MTTLQMLNREAGIPDILPSAEIKSLTVPVCGTETQYLTGSGSSSPGSLMRTITKSSFETRGISSVMWLKVSEVRWVGFVSL